MKKYKDSDYPFAGRPYNQVRCSKCNNSLFYIGFDNESFLSVCEKCGNKSQVYKELVEKSGGNSDATAPCFRGWRVIKSRGKGHFFQTPQNKKRGGQVNE